MYSYLTILWDGGGALCSEPPDYAALHPGYFALLLPPRRGKVGMGVVLRMIEPVILEC